MGSAVCLEDWLSVTDSDLARRIHAVSHLEGRFTLRSGRVATEYFDKYRFEGDPLLLDEIAQRMVPSDTEVLAGLEMGGIPVVTALGRHTGLPCAFVRKQAKAYGTCRLAEGTDVAGRRVSVVEDVVTSGGDRDDVTRRIPLIQAVSPTRQARTATAPPQVSVRRPRL
nr:orotate phosphoribosyltransferase [Streptomyces sp. NBC_00886]